MSDKPSAEEREVLNDIKRTLVKPDTGAGLGLASIMGLSKQELDAMYATACQQVQSGQTKESAKLFGTLIALNHNEGKYWRGMGLTMQKMKMWPASEFFYGAALKRDPNDFVSRVFLAEVMLKLNKPARARVEVDRAIEDGKRLAKSDTMAFVKRGERLRSFIISAGETSSGLDI